MTGRGEEETIQCPMCGHPNLRGEDRCEKCMAPLRDLDVPGPTTGLQKRLMSDDVGMLPLEAAVTLAPDAPVADAVEAMRREKVSALLVFDGDDLAGIVTELDLLYKVGEEDDLQGVALSEIMTTDVETLRPDDKVVVALNRMSARGYRHIPVLKGKTALGVLTVGGLLEYVTGQVG